MTDTNRDWVELRREIVEARNQAIKTDNQIKNLSLDVKGFEKRFDGLERRTRVASIGAHAIAALTVAMAAYVIHSVRVRALTSEIAARTTEVAQQTQSANKMMDEARTRLKLTEEERNQRERSSALATKLVDHLDNKREKEAIELLDNVDVKALTPLEAKLLEKRLGDLREKAAESAYKAGKSAVSSKNADGVVNEMRKVLRYDPEGRFGNGARYYLATQLWSQKKYEEAEVVFREVLKKETDKAVLDESKYLFGLNLGASNKRPEGKVLLAEVAKGSSRYASQAKDQLTAWENEKSIEQPAPQANAQ